MKVFEVIDFIDNHQSFFKTKSDAWNHIFDFIEDAGIPYQDVFWLKGDYAFIATHGLDRLVGMIEHELVDG